MAQAANPASKPRILIVAHGNEYIEVFSDSRDVVVKIVNVPAMHSINGESLIEDLLAIRLPKVWSAVCSEGWLVDRDAIRNMQVDDICKRDEELRLIATMNGIIAKNNEVQQCK